MKSLTEWFGSLFVIAVWIFGLVGWVLNIMQIANADHITGMVAVRIIGVVMVPLGAILGWF